MILFDDIGSYPLPRDITKDWIAQAVIKNDPKLVSIQRDAMMQKIDAGVEVPTYPQFQDMNQQFLRIINDETMTEEPLLVKKDKAIIQELGSLEEVGAAYHKKHGKKLDVRVCLTGPLELYLKQFGGTAYVDVLHTFAASIDRFIANSIENAKNISIKTISIDEPSIGINPQIMFNDRDIADALERSAYTAGAYKIDTEIHLHSPLHYRLVCDVPSIKIIGVESAANPSYLDLIYEKDLLDHDKFLRAGVARTDIFGMAAVLNEKYNLNVWKDAARLSEILTQMETPSIIEKRLKKAYSLFGDRIKYAGPDCGLGSWPSQGLAFGLLKNTGIGIKEFMQNQKTG